MLLGETRSHSDRLWRIKFIKGRNVLPKDVLSVNRETTLIEVVAHTLQQMRRIIHEKNLVVLKKGVLTVTLINFQKG